MYSACVWETEIKTRNFVPPHRQQHPKIDNNLALPGLPNEYSSAPYPLPITFNNPVIEQPVSTAVPGFRDNTIVVGEEELNGRVIQRENEAFEEDVRDVYMEDGRIATYI